MVIMFAGRPVPLQTMACLPAYLLALVFLTAGQGDRRITTRMGHVPAIGNHAANNLPGGHDKVLISHSREDTVMAGSISLTAPGPAHSYETCALLCEVESAVGNVRVTGLGNASPFLAGGEAGWPGPGTLSQISHGHTTTSPSRLLLGRVGDLSGG